MYILPPNPILIEHTQSDYALFEAATTLREAVVREWSLLSVEQKNSLRQYIMQYIISKPRYIHDY